MRIGVTKLFRVLLILLLLSSCGKKSGTEPYEEQSGVSWVSVIRDSLNLNTLASPLRANERSLHFSSSAAAGKETLVHLAPEIFGDMDHGSFLNVEEGESGIDATLAETTGPGMITWMWSANPIGTLRLFIDDREKPVLETSFARFIGGSFLPRRSPFSSLTARGHNLHFPIIHTNYCKVVIRVPRKEDLASLYYQVAWNSLDPASILHPFDVDDIGKGEKLLNSFAKNIEAKQEEVPLSPTKHVELNPGSCTPIFSSSEPGTISLIIFQTDRDSDLAHLRLRAFWDGSNCPSIDCPLHLLAGVSKSMENSLSLPVAVRGNQVVLRWPMPYRTARIEIVTPADRIIPLHYSVETSSQTGRLRLNATHKLHPDLRTENENVLTLTDIKGSGRIVGCNIVVHTRTPKWWGEGDQLIYLDSPSKPVWRGTGTEDYFGFAWCSTKTFDHPFRGQSRVNQSGERRTSAMHRYHLMDRLPFHISALFQTEAWGLAEGMMDYESVILYYLELK